MKALISLPLLLLFIACADAPTAPEGTGNPPTVLAAEANPESNGATFLFKEDYGFWGMYSGAYMGDMCEASFMDLTRRVHAESDQHFSRAEDALIKIRLDGVLYEGTGYARAFSPTGTGDTDRFINGVVYDPDGLPYQGKCRYQKRNGKPLKWSWEVKPIDLD
jgi:hypothetical protein